MEGEGEDQATTDQTSATKTKSIFIAQNVASLQELGETQPSSLGPKKCWKNLSPLLHLTALSGKKLSDLKGSLSCLVIAKGVCGWNGVVTAETSSVYLCLEG